MELGIPGLVLSTQELVLAGWGVCERAPLKFLLSSLFLFSVVPLRRGWGLPFSFSWFVSIRSKGELRNSWVRLVTD